MASIASAIGAAALPAVGHDAGHSNARSIESRDGAAGNIGTDLAGRAKPEGYSHLSRPDGGTVSVNPHLFTNLGVKPLEDFLPISRVLDGPSLMVATSGFPAANARMSGYPSSKMMPMPNYHNSTF